jgi:hypothetical protein
MATVTVTVTVAMTATAMSVVTQGSILSRAAALTRTTRQSKKWKEDPKPGARCQGHSLLRKLREGGRQWCSVCVCV